MAGLAFFSICSSNSSFLTFFLLPPFFLIYLFVRRAACHHDFLPTFTDISLTTTMTLTFDSVPCDSDRLTRLSTLDLSISRLRLRLFFFSVTCKPHSSSSHRHSLTLSFFSLTLFFTTIFSWTNCFWQILMIPFIPIFSLFSFFPDLRVNKTNTKLLIIFSADRWSQELKIEDRET